MQTNRDSQPAITRRDTLRRVLLGTVALSAAAAPQPATTAQPLECKDEPFVPENDYPFFGAEPPDAH